MQLVFGLVERLADGFRVVFGLRLRKVLQFKEIRGTAVTMGQQEVGDAAFDAGGRHFADGLVVGGVVGDVKERGLDVAFAEVEVLVRTVVLRKP